MSELTLDELRASARRINAGETSIEDEATRHSVAELTDALRLTRGTLHALIDGWTQGQLLVRPSHAPDETLPPEDSWSATEALTHLIATQNWYLMHLVRLLGRREMFDIMPRGLGDLARQDVPKAELVAGLRAATERALATFASVPADADLGARRETGFGFALSIRGFMYMVIGHDLQHLSQIKRLQRVAGFASA